MPTFLYHKYMHPSPGVYKVHSEVKSESTEGSYRYASVNQLPEPEEKCKLPIQVGSGARLNHTSNFGSVSLALTNLPQLLTP